MRAMLFLFVLSCAACEAVPDVTYVTSDAGDENGDENDGAGDARVDVADAPAPADGSDTCPASIPSYATYCCTAIPCAGAMCAAVCPSCQGCSPDQLCCPNSQGHVTCKSTSGCP